MKDELWMYSSCDGNVDGHEDIKYSMTGIK